MSELIACPSCGLRLPRDESAPDSRVNASSECWQLYMELLAYTLSKGDSDFIHQVAVDAYGAQHSGGPTRNITTVYALVGLCLAIEHGFTGRQVQRAHMALAKTKSDWPRLDPPATCGVLTVRDVLQAESGEPRDAMLMAWARSIWAAWPQAAQEWVRGIARGLLGVP